MSCLYLPVNLNERTNIKETLGYLTILKNKGFETGLMCLMRGGLDAYSEKNKTVQYENFSAITHDTAVPVIVMVANLPLTDLDFYHLPEKSATHIKEAINFADSLPGRGKNPLVTFHLNTLLTPDEYDPSENYDALFNKKILPQLAQLAEYGKQKHVTIKIETTPVPEFGDLDDPHLNTLINPYPVYSKYFEKIRNAGLGIAFDLCHTFALLKKMNLPRSLMDEVALLVQGDVLHLNDSKDLFLPEKNLLHKEGATLGEGEIDDLPQIIRYSISKDFPIVFEINDEYYDKGSRPNLEKSIRYFFDVTNK